MRKLMWFTLGAAAACGGCAYLLTVEQIPVMVLFAAGMTGAAFFLKRKKPHLRVAVAVFLGFLMGCGWFWLFETHYLEAPRDLDGSAVALSIRVTDYSYETEYGIGADGVFDYEGRSYRIRFYLNDTNALSPGDRVRGMFHMRLAVRGGEEDATYHGGNGIFLLGYPAGDAVVNQIAGLPLQYYPQYLRHEWIGLLEKIFPENTAAFAQALLLGEDHDLDYETNTALSISGIRHIIAVSGLHVSIFCALLMALTGKRPLLSALVCGGVLLVFAAVVGFTPSVTRACVMMLLMLLATLFGREYDPPTSLSFAVLVMLGVNPYVITSVSFQLSVGCMAGIFLFSGPVYTYLMDERRLGRFRGEGILAKLSRGFSASVSISLGAMSLTTPLSAYYFGTVSLVGVMTNLLTLWAVSLIFYGILVASLLACIWLPLGKLAAWLIAWLIRYVLMVAKVLASFPLAAVYTCSKPVVLWLVACYIMLVIYLIFKRKHFWIYGVIAVAGLCAAMLLSWITPAMDHVRVTVLDVGQGQCVLLQSQGKTYMVDCGGDSPEEAADIAAEALLSQGITRLDGLIITHYDEDHCGAAENLLTRIPADQLYLPSGEGSPLTQLDNALIVAENTILSYADTQMILFPADVGQTDNESSMCVLFQAGNCDILITGDRDTLGEAMLLRQMDFPELEVLIAGHHGSKTSTGPLLLETLSPEVVMISVGEDNSYGHPAQEVLDRLADFGCIVHRTDLEGTIIYRR